MVGVLSLSGTANAALVRADVGLNDTYFGACTQGLPASAHNEAACLATVIPGTTHTDIYQNINASNPFEELMDEAGVYAMDLQPGYHSDYILIRTGNIGGAHGQYTFIFENNADTGFAVIDLSLFNIALGLYEDGLTMSNIGKISHVTGVSVAPVPLPAAAWMFMGAIGGMLGFRKFSLRRRKTA